MGFVLFGHLEHAVISTDKKTYICVKIAIKTLSRIVCFGRKTCYPFYVFSNWMGMSDMRKPFTLSGNIEKTFFYFTTTFGIILLKFQVRDSKSISGRGFENK